MVKKPEKPDRRNNYKKIKPKKDRAFLFGSKKWSADEYFSSDDDLQIETNSNDIGANNSFFDDEDSRVNRRSSAHFTARKAVSKKNSSFLADEDTGVEEEVSLPFVAEENEDTHEIADKASKQLEQDTHEVVEEEKPKKQGLFSSRKKRIEHIADKAAGQESVLDTDETMQADASDSDNTIPAVSKQRKRKSHSELFSKLEDVEFEETELPEEILSTEAIADESKEYEEPKKRSSLFTRFDKDEKTPVDEDIADETIDEENTVPKKKGRGLFSRSNVEETKESEEANETVTKMEYSQDDMEEKPRAHRKNHSNLLNSLKQVEFEGNEVPEEVLMAEAAEDEAAPQAEPSNKSKDLFASSKKSSEPESGLSDELEESSDKTKKHSFLSHFLKDEEPDALDEEKQEENIIPFEDEVTEEPQGFNDDKVFEEQQEQKPIARRKDHSALLARLNEVKFEESEVPEEVLFEEASEEEEYEQPKKRRGIFARLEENEAEDFIETDEITKDVDINKGQQEDIQFAKSEKKDEELYVEEEVKVQPEAIIKDTSADEFGSELSAGSEGEEDIEPVFKEKKLGWFRRFFYRDIYDEELIDEEGSKENEPLKTREKRSGLSAFFYNDEEELDDDIELDSDKYISSESKPEHTAKRSRTDSVLKEVEEIADKPLTIEEDIKKEKQPINKRSSILAHSEEAGELDEVLADDEGLLPKRSRSMSKRRNKRVSSKQAEIDEVTKTTEADKLLVKPTAASVSSIIDEEPEPKKRTRKPVGRRDSSFLDILAAVKNILPRRKSDSKALTFAEVNKHNKKIRTRRIFIYAGTGILAVAVALVFILVPLGGKPVDTQPNDDSMVAISDPVDTEEPTQKPTDIPTTEPDPIPEVVQTPIVTTQPDPTHQTINIDNMVDDFKVEADLYYNKVGYSTNYYKYTENEMYILAQLIHGEARGESLDGMVAVGNVVMNRVLNRRVFGNNIKSVVTAPYQFSGYNSNIVPSSKCKIAARKVLDFQVWVVPQNIYYFKAYGAVGQDWASHKYYTKIGGHYFYTHIYGGRSNTSKIPPRLFERTYMWPRMGCEPEDRVYMIQYMLNGLGYDVKADSYFGEGTMEELKKFQDKKGLDADGVAGPTTIEALIRAYGLENFYDKFYT